MDADRFGAVTRTLSRGSSRRMLLRLFPAGSVAFTMLSLRRAERVSAKLKRNKYGCVNVGNPCQGRDEVCCSGVCKGKKPKKGEQDKTECVAHNVGGCTLDRAHCINPTLSACSKTAKCLVTTGKAPFCAENEGSSLEANCQRCRKDTDCEELGFGKNSACVLLRTEGACVNSCEGVNGSKGTACFPPGR